MKENPFKKLIAVATSFLMLSCGTDYGKFSIFASEFDEPENYPPSVMGIPGESIDEGKRFGPIKLDKFVTDEDSANAIKWSVSGNKYLKVSISADHIATIEIPDPYWNGSEDITFIATDTKGAEGSETVRFTVNSVNNPPEVQKIPDQTVNEGHTFTGIKLDDYVTDPDHPKNKIRWTCKITPIGTDQAIGDLTVEIDPNRVATVIIPDANWYGSAKIEFMASDPEGASGSTTANFVVNSVNDAPEVQKIPNQTIVEGETFAKINLDDYVIDPDHQKNEIQWGYEIIPIGNGQAEGDLTVEIDSDRVASVIIPNPNWYGSAEIKFTATDNGGLSDFQTATFIVKPGITVAPTDHGTVTVNDNVFEGETVKLTVTPDTGHVVKSVIVNDGAVHVTVNGDGTYSFTMPAEHVNVSVEFEKQRFTVTWKNGDTVLETDENVEYGTTPEYNGVTPTKAATAQYTYTFSGWSPEVDTVTGDVTYTAQFDSTVNKYTVTWKNGNTVLETDENVEYGATPEYNGETPTKAATAQYTFTFSGWTPEVDTVTGDVTYTAQFDSTVNKYTVTWKNDDTVLETDENVEYGTTPEYNGAAPTKNGAIFLGWTADGVNAYDFETPVTAETTLTAMWLDASGFITFSEGYAVIDNTYNGTDRDYVGFRFDVNMDNSNYTVVQHGILYGMNIATFSDGKADANLRFTDEEATALMDKVREFAAQNTDTETTDWIEVYIGDRRDGVVYARGFIIVTDDTNNYLIYSDVQEGSYNSFSE